MSRRIARSIEIFRRNSGEPLSVIPGRCEAIQFLLEERLDCFVADAPLHKRFAFVAGNDAKRASPRRGDRPLDLAEPDTVTVALAPTAHHERVAVFEKRALDAAWKLQRLGAVP